MLAASSGLSPEETPDDEEPDMSASYYGDPAMITESETSEGRVVDIAGTAAGRHVGRLQPLTREEQRSVRRSLLGGLVFAVLLVVGVVILDHILPDAAGPHGRVHDRDGLIEASGVRRPNALSLFFRNVMHVPDLRAVASTPNRTRKRSSERWMTPSSVIAEIVGRLP